MKRVGVHGAGFIPITQMAPCPAGAVAGDWWDPNNDGLCVWAAYQPKGAANLAASYVDLSGNGNNTGPGVAPTWDAVNGWKFDGATQYLVTTFVPALDQSQSAIVQYTTVTAGDCSLCQCRGGVGNRNFGLQPWRIAGGAVGYGNGLVSPGVPQLLAGNLAVAGDKGYRNGALDFNGILAWSDTAPAMWIGARNNVGVADFFLPGYIQALAIYDCTLTGPQVAAVAAAMAAL